MHNETGTTPSPKRRSRKARRRAAKRAAQERARAEADDAADVRASALLADPATIAGAPDAGRPVPPEVRAESPIPTPTAASSPDAEGAPDRSDLDRLRTALRFQSEELETLRSKWRRDAELVPDLAEGAPPDHSVAAAEHTPTPSPLMDARSARRLAANARARERASRDALERAKRAIGHTPPAASHESPAERSAVALSRDHEPEVATDASRLAPGGTEQEDVSQQDRRASATADAVHVATPSPGSRVAPEPAMPELERGAPAPTESTATAGGEVAELKSLLAFARETSAHQRESLRALRARVAALERGDSDSAIGVPVEASESDPTPIEMALDGAASPLDPMSSEPLECAASMPDPEPHPSHFAADLDRLREQLAKATAEIDRHRREKAFLEEALEERVQQLRARREEHEALRDRFEAQARALDTARREYELERSRHGRTLDTLAELQSTLSRALPVDRIAAGEGRPRSQAPQAVHAEGGLSSVVAPAPASAPAPALQPGPRPSTDGWATVALDSGSEIADLAAIPAASQPPTHLGSGSRAYGHWLDERVRSRFGPLGAERFVDLFRDASRTTGRLGRAERTLVVLAREASTVAARIAESLLLSGTSRFTIHYAEAPACGRDSAHPRSMAELPLAFDSPIRGSLEAVEAIASPDALGAALDVIRPDAVVCHDFLSRERDPGPWLDRLLAETHAGATLVLAERIGIAPSPTPPPIAEIAERIWSKLPERYTRSGSRRDRIEDWQAAFLATTDRPENDLLEALRARTPLGLVDRFGYLALSYVDSPIAENFDVASDRDRRFLAQLADLDERRIESGEAPPLAFVARVDPDPAG